MNTFPRIQQVLMQLQQAVYSAAVHWILLRNVVVCQRRRSKSFLCGLQKQPKPSPHSHKASTSPAAVSIRPRQYCTVIWQPEESENLESVLFQLRVNPMPWVAGKLADWP